MKKITIIILVLIHIAITVNAKEKTIPEIAKPLIGLTLNEAEAFLDSIDNFVEITLKEKRKGGVECMFYTEINGAFVSFTLSLWMKDEWNESEEPTIEDIKVNIQHTSKTNMIERNNTIKCGDYNSVRTGRLSTDFTYN